MGINEKPIAAAAELADFQKEQPVKDTEILFEVTAMSAKPCKEQPSMKMNQKTEQPAVKELENPVVASAVSTKPRKEQPAIEASKKIETHPGSAASGLVEDCSEEEELVEPTSPGRIGRKKTETFFHEFNQ